MACHALRAGTVAPVERGRRAQRFNADATVQVMLLTTAVGSLGLNLTGADVVVFVDHDWNPMRDLQVPSSVARVVAEASFNSPLSFCCVLGRGTVMLASGHGSRASFGAKQHSARLPLECSGHTGGKNNEVCAVISHACTKKSAWIAF